MIAASGRLNWETLPRLRDGGASRVGAQSSKGTQTGAALASKRVLVIFTFARCWGGLTCAPQARRYARVSSGRGRSELRTVRRHLGVGDVKVRTAPRGLARVLRDDGTRVLSRSDRRLTLTSAHGPTRLVASGPASVRTRGQCGPHTQTAGERARRACKQQKRLRCVSPACRTTRAGAVPAWSVRVTHSLLVSCNGAQGRLIATLPHIAASCEEFKAFRTAARAEDAPRRWVGPLGRQRPTRLVP